MSPRQGRSERLTRAAIAALVCACFVLQQLVVAVHLAENDHLYPGTEGPIVTHALTNAAHAHTGDRHPHSHSGDVDDVHEGEHEPHSAADHESLLVGWIGGDVPQLFPLFACPTDVAMPILDSGCYEHDGEAQPRPRPPPPKAAIPLRAPPTVS